MPTLWRAWGVQRRVLGALFLREIQIRWGRRNLGFAWIIAEPLIFAFPVIIMWSYIRAPFEHGVPLIALVWSGYLPLLMFRHTTSQALYVIRSNGAMLYRHELRELDAVEVGTQITAHPDAAALVELAIPQFETEQFDRVFDVVPRYLRKSDAEIAWDQRARGATG